MAPNDQLPILSEIAPPQLSSISQAPGDRKRIGVIGAGISGMAAAWLLAQRHDVILYEKGSVPGGHSNTVDIDLPEGRVAVDTGFIVFNERTYPNLTALFDYLGVATQATAMSFAASVDNGAFEYSGTGLRGLFAQRRNMFRPRMWRMVADILRFYREAKLAGCHPDMTLGEYLTERGYRPSFINDHLLPMGGAIWSTSPEQMLQHPLSAFIRFCDNHGLLQLADRPSWRTVCGGSRNYVKRLLQDRQIRLVVDAQIDRIERSPAGPNIVFRDQTKQHLDAVVVATHADQALTLLASPTAQERRLLGAMRYTANAAVLHGDPALMPRRRAAWSSWNVMGAVTQTDRPQICVTYWMNQLQHLPVKQPVLVTLNPDRPIRDDLVWGRFDYAHPLFDAQSVAAQSQLWSLQGQGGIWYCGAYFGAGFHEDGLQAGLAAAEMLGGVHRPWHVSQPSGRIHVAAPSGATGVLGPLEAWT